MGDAAPTTSLDLDAITARAQAATEGPWGVDDRDGDEDALWQDGHGVLMAGEKFVYVCEHLHQGENGKADAEFIAHARTDVPALVEEVKRLRHAHTDDCVSSDQHDRLMDEVERLRAEVSEMNSEVRKMNADMLGEILKLRQDRDEALAMVADLQRQG